MDSTQALAQLSVHLQASVDPVLSSDELGVLLEEMQRVDENGKKPIDVGWIPTYDRAALASAVVRGWEMKAAKVVADVNHAEDGAQFSASDVHEHCMKQAASWRKRIVAGISLKRSV